MYSRALLTQTLFASYLSVFRRTPESMALDYDRHDATLHYIFKETQGDAWFRPSEENVSTGVCLRVDYGENISVFLSRRILLLPLSL